MIKYLVNIIKIRKGKNMNYETVTNLINKISEIQEVLIQNPPSFPTNFGYIFSRFFLYASMIIWVFYFSSEKETKNNKEKICDRIFEIITGYFFISLILFCFTVLIVAFDKNEQNVKEYYFAPIELIQITFRRNEFNSKKKEVSKEREEILQRINRLTNGSTKFTELGTAKKFLEKKEKILRAEHEKESKILEKIMSISKKEVLLSTINYDFLKKLDEKQLEYLAKSITFHTETYKNFSELKMNFDEILENNLPDFFKNNPAVEDYINNLSEKVDKELNAEKI